MELVIKIKPCTTLAQAEELFDELTENESFMDLIEDIKLTPGGGDGMSEDNGKYTPGDRINADYDVPPNTERDDRQNIIDEITDLKQIVFMQSSGHIRRQLFELPDDIRTQSLKLVELTNHTEALRLSLVHSKNEALELVLSATETDMGKTKQKYSNEQSRKVALESLLRNNKLYLDNIDELSRKECELRKGQTQLEYLHNQFRAFLAVAGMQGARS